MRDILFRIGLLKSGLMTEAEVMVLISDCMATHNVHWLPTELQAQAQRWLKEGKLTRPLGSVN